MNITTRKWLNMKFKCCDFLLHEIVFAQAEVIPCCCSPKHEYETRFLKNFNGGEFDAEEYIKQKEQYINLFKEGKTPDCCVGCSMIREEAWDETNTIKRIIISNRTKCSCNCIYCSLVTTSNQTKEELNTRKAYDIIPVLKDLRSKNLIGKNCEILVAGGECCEYPVGELDEIIYLATQLECKLEILSSGIIFSSAIENALKNGKTTLKVSVDSGYKKTYEKIKRVKAYNRVWDNLKQYIASTSFNNSSIVKIKYIILPSLNDNKREVLKFIDNCKKINCKNIEIAIEYIWYGENKNKPINKNIEKIVAIFEKSGLNISFEMQCLDYLKKIGH